MQGATFLLAINCAIGILFAIAFFGMSRGTSIALARWCGAGFLFAAATVLVEAFAWYIPVARLTSFLSFTCLIMALGLITAGLWRHYRPGCNLDVLWFFIVLILAFHPLILFDLDRDTPLHAFGYQLPFAILASAGAAAIVSSRRRRAVDLALLATFGLSAIQFIGKAAMASAITTGGNVQNYILSSYAYVSQTVAAILSLILGSVLLSLVLIEVMAEKLNLTKRDALSGALLRAEFLDRAKVIIDTSIHPVPSTLVFADLDHFKSINDRFGHAAGDEVISAFGAILLRLCGGTGLCGRMGGEEFAIILPNTDKAAAALYVETARSLLANHRFELLPDEIRATASFGIAIVEKPEPVSMALRRADLALYAAKASGRDTYRFSESISAGHGIML